MEIYCCGCTKNVEARLTDGAEIYPHRSDLKSLPFWKCDDCLNYVGCHHKTENRTQPLGVIPTKDLMKARRHIHALIDPIFQSGKMTRKQIYKNLSDGLGWKYHTAKIKSIEEARQVYKIAKTLT